MKRGRVSFPEAVLQLLYSALVDRSGFLRDQINCCEESAGECLLELPEEEGKLWLQGVLCTLSHLQDSTNAQLAQFLKVRLACETGC